MSQWIKLLSHQYIGGEMHKPGVYLYVGNQYAEQLFAAGQAESMIASVAPINGNAGVVYVVYGDAAIKEVKGSIASLRQFYPEIGIGIISDGDTGLDAEHIYHADEDIGARAAKLAVYHLSPFDKTLYLDADTVVVGPIDCGFKLLDFFDMVLALDIVETANDGALHPNSFGYTQEERNFTTYRLPTALASQFACGMVFFNKADDTEQLFSSWRNEWGRWRGRDQAAFLRALSAVPIRILAVPSEWNVSGASMPARVIHHRWGAARRRVA